MTTQGGSNSVRSEPVERGGRHFFFAGGGTGGHIYPAIAVAGQITKIEPAATTHFFCSMRSIDERVLGPAGFEHTTLPARGFSFRLRGLIGFCRSFLESYRTAKQAISEYKNAVVIGAGGFVSAPVCLAAHKCSVPIALLNVDIIPGRANKIIARWADEIFVQFEETARYFAAGKAKASVVGCPLRSGFKSPEPNEAIEQLGLDKEKKILLITGASSGSANINKAVCSLLEKLDGFADDWQIVHLAGRDNHEEINNRYSNAKISHKVLGYFDNMPDLLAAAHLLVGRSGAVSVAEYAAAGVPSICIPYPYHKDRHQYLNAGKLVEAGAAVIVDDVPDEEDMAQWLWEELEDLMKDEGKRQAMAQACRAISSPDADLKIAERLLTMADGK
ncbi:MAG: UDP-N-acetylglucosamine--N-acetylmuramyl-(pentapeptide) pyrophosphoryl-undecaprenol N-acetylglucosamine transferase [Planctomycetota bacterium]|jgi:UDP-N-acetylglucosamine--N-acetylmuramyl-(pentapeptide) pyrophosphoryl-undecaprenol N-acetylglucosamine transferase